MTQNPIFIINPKSHRVSIKGSVLSQVAVDFGDIPVVYFDGSKPLSETLIPLLSQESDAVYVEGGDGTVVAALTACFEGASQGLALPRIAVLPGGSTNLAHKLLGVKVVDPQALKQRIGQRKRDPQTHESTMHTALLVETSETKTPYLGFLLSTGSLARLMLYTQQNLHGKTRGVVSIARAIAQLALFPNSTKFSDGLPVVRPSEFSTLAEGMPVNVSEQTFSVFSTFRELSLRLSPFWGRGEAPIGYTEATWPIRQMRLGIARALLTGARNGLEHHGLSSQGCSAMTFRTDGPVLLDGEALPIPDDQTFNVSVSPSWEFVR
ncbi:MAG: diacylglycerol kinase family protein [Henriciella sp.]|nr:diacylglycerol kinase family protein [Henriciella sp.]